MKTKEQKPTWNEVLKELRAEYMAVLPERLALIQKLTSELSVNPMASLSLTDLNREYHKLKGTGRTYGFGEISTLCERLETLTSKPQPLAIAPLERGPELLAYLIDSYQNEQVPKLEEHPAWRLLAEGT